MLEKLSLSVFQEALGSTFRIHVDGARPVDVDLTEAIGLKRRGDVVPGGLEREPFSLLFHGPADMVLAQSTYKFEHDHIGKFDMFIVPVGPDEKGMRYEAIFN